MKKVGLFDLTQFAVGSVIGAGIFTILMFGISLTGRSIVLALAFALILGILQPVRHVIMSAMFELDGGMYDQQKLLMPPVLVGANTILWLTGAFMYAMFAISIVDYLVQVIPALANYRTIAGVVIVTLFFLIVARGTGFLAKVQTAMTICMYAALALLVVFGLMNGGSESAKSIPYFAGGVKGFFMAAGMMTFACSGSVNNVVNLSGEVENPKRNVLLALLLSTIILAICYGLLGHVAATSFTPGEAADLTLGAVAQQVLPSGLYVFFVIGGAVFAISTTLLGTLGSVGAPLVACANEGWLPKALGKSAKNGCPYVMYILFYVVTIIPIVTGASFDFILSMILVPESALYIISGFYSFKLPQKYPKAWENSGLKMPYAVYCMLIVLSILASAFIAYFSLVDLDMAGLITNLVVSLAFVVYSYWRVKSGKVDVSKFQLTIAE